MIHSFEGLSLVVQGGVNNPLTARCMEALRKQFPNAELILSTWESSDVTGLLADKIVFSPDPGATVCDEVAGVLNNVNRQLVSTKAGIAAASRPFILKTRTDILFRNADFCAILAYLTASRQIIFVIVYWFVTILPETRE